MKTPAPREDGDAAQLRRRADALLQAAAPEGAPALAEDRERLLHELQVHQIELELQNEELRRARAEVEEVLERYADFYDFSPVGFFTLARDGAIGRVNLSGARLFGLERSRLVGRRFAIFVAEAARAVFEDFLKAAFAGQTGQDREIELALDGAPSRMVRISATLSLDLQECRAVVVDVTAQKEVERALRDSERRFRDVADISADWIWEVDMAGRYTYASESVRPLLGYGPEDIIGKTAFDLMPPDEALRVGQEFAAIAQRGMAFRDLENIVLDSQGGRHDTLTSGTPIFDATGAMAGYRGVDRDVTKRRLAEAELAASQQRFRDIVNTTDGIVWEADARTFDCTFVSRQAERLLGYPVEEWRRPGFWISCLHPDDREWVAEYALSSTRRMAGYDLEYRFIARDGRMVWLHDIVTVVAENGAPRWLRGIMVDITRRRQAEEKLVDLAASLEAKVQERTAQVRKLSAQLTMTEERERRMLAADLHDNLGQLLAVIKIKLTSLPIAGQAAEIAQIEGLVAQADRAARSITQQLSPPILQRLGLTAALEWLGEEMQRVYGLVVHVDFDECSKRLVDEIQAILYRSARELLINVAKHAGVREASLSCMCDGDRLMIAVSDAGCGFDPAEHFGAWPGHGSFGLRSIQERITNLGGDIDVDSSPGNGATITVSVPRFIGEQEICDDPNNACR
ncbi:MAG: PAS domain S-box protein [Sulfuritalea sp.]|nr:PAS domain S-box protein [Sulfuritalea sp.]